MTLAIKTTTGTIQATVKTRLDAARVLMDLQRMGVQLKRWEVVEC